MDTNLKTSIWGQFGAAIDYLADTIDACPDDLWQASLWKTTDTPPELSQFWYVTYHTLFWLNLHLTGSEEDFLPAQPEKVYTKAELMDYLKRGRERCKATIGALTDEMAAQQCELEWGNCSFLELLFYNLRHVHGHASQLDMLLGQVIGPQPDYVTQARGEAL